MLGKLWGRKKADEPQPERPEGKGLFARLRERLSKTRENILGKLSSILSGREIDEEMLERIEEVLVEADVGVETTMKLMDRVRELIEEKGVKEPPQVLELLKEEILGILGEDRPLEVSGAKPFSIMVLGVNGVGKTTTIGKLAARFKNEGKRVLVAAADTFRAAADEQLEIWCNRAGVELIKGAMGADPAAVVFDAIQAAKARDVDGLIVDTAGRLHTKKPLMMELQKIARVMGRELPGAPHEVLLVLDATTGQNAINQAKAFTKAIDVTGIFLAKLDGTAKGGIVVAIRNEVSLPVKFVGIGETYEDVQPFDPDGFVEALFA